MSRASGDPHGVLGGALAGDLECTVIGALEDQGRLQPGGGLLDKRPGAGRTHLLVGGDEQPDPPGCAEGGEGEERLDEPRLHVHDPGPRGPAALDPEGPALQGAARPDGVEMAEEEHPRPSRLPEEVGRAAGIDQLAPAPHEALQHRVDGVQRRPQQGGLAARRFLFHQRLQAVEHLRLAAAQAVEERQEGGARRALGHAGQSDPSGPKTYHPGASAASGRRPRAKSEVMA